MDKQISRILDYIRKGQNTELTAEVSESVKRVASSIDSLLETSQAALEGDTAVQQYNAAWNSISKSSADLTAAFNMMDVRQKSWLADLLKYHAPGKKKPKVALPELDLIDLIGDYTRLKRLGKININAISKRSLVYFASEAAKEMVDSVSVAKRTEQILQNYRDRENRHQNGRHYSPATMLRKSLQMVLRG